MSTPPLPEKAPAFRSQRRGREIASVLRRKRRLRAGVAQLLAVVLALALAFLVPRLPIGAKIPTTRVTEMLVAAGAGMVAFIGIVYSLLFLVVQFGTTTFTPRLNLFRDSPIVWRAFSFYTAVVVYSLAASLVIGGDETTRAIVPIVAFTAVLVSIVLYRQLQTSAFNSIQLASTLAQVMLRGREVIDGLYTLDAPATDPADIAPGAGDEPAGLGDRHEIRWPRPAAVLQVIDVPRVLRAAEHADAVIDFKLGAGETIAEGGVLAVTGGPPDATLEQEVVKACTAGVERTFEQDPAFALRVLADIALRALSAAVNDPTTAVQSLDATDSLLRVLAARELDVGQIGSSDGLSRVRLVLPTWEDYIALAFDEIIALAAVSPNVSRRILRLLDDLDEIAPEYRRPALDARRSLVHVSDGQHAAGTR
jgi:uncharacterized membrane protein